MQKLIILAALAACCLAAPSAISKDNQEVLLVRPSPINPDVPMEPKPAEKVTVITDPKEIAKYKRETDNKKHNEPVIPTALPEHHPAATTQQEQEHKAENDHDHIKHRVKRDSGRPNEKHDNTKVQPLANKPVQKPAAITRPKATPPQTHKKNEPVRHEPARHEPAKQEPARHEPAKHEPAKHEPAKHEVVKHRQKRDVASSSSTVVPVDLEHKNEDSATHAVLIVPPPAVYVPLTNKNESNEPHVDALENKHSAQEPQVRPQILPAFLPVGAEVNPHALPAIVKRDIPVPLVPKHKHPEETPKDDDKTSEEDSDEESEEKKSDKKKPEENKPTDEHKIQDIKKSDVENLNGAVPLQHPKPISLEQQHNTHQNSEQQSQNSAHNNVHTFIHHEQQEQHHFQPQHPHVASHQAEVAAQQKESNSAAESTPSSTEHPVLRHKPVPVAELFARQNEKQQNSDVEKTII